jgi:hypothetical protein
MTLWNGKSFYLERDASSLICIDYGFKVDIIKMVKIYIKLVLINPDSS